MLEILTVLTGVALAQIAPGPNLVATAGSALASGRAAGLATAAGIAVSVLWWAALFAFGVGTLLAAFPELVTTLRFAGGGYLVWLAARPFLSANRQTLRPDTTRATLRAAFAKGVFVNVTNPKTAMMWIAISLFLGAEGPSPGRLFAVGCAMAASAALIYGTYALLFSSGPATRGYHRFYRSIETGFAAIFGTMGAQLIWEGLQDLQGQGS